MPIYMQELQIVEKVCLSKHKKKRIVNLPRKKLLFQKWGSFRDPVTHPMPEPTPFWEACRKIIGAKYDLSFLRFI
jgi:hypothetical protein